MQRLFNCLLGATFVLIFMATAALAHAFLDRATPGVGETVHASPNELRLQFTQNIVAAFSGVGLRTVAGQAMPLGRAVVSGNILKVSISRHLKPGIYVVSWHVVSVDTHPTSGAYKFIVAP